MYVYLSVDSQNTICLGGFIYLCNRLYVEVNEVVEPIVYLLSDKSSMINGAVLPIDGGFLAT